MTASRTVPGVIGMSLANMPQVPVMVVFVPGAVGIVFASLPYIGVMPRLWDFSELGILIFAVVFLICYLFHTPEQGLGRTFGLTMSIMIAGISN
ncbi:MAG: hypothetical protein GY703_20325 [Gammaproteobacteria bacterium]|nr:hypothetical protein [Gammaproteobacteria bacterium]